MKMIVIGGSAGGLAPLKVILRDLPPSFHLERCPEEQRGGGAIEVGVCNGIIIAQSPSDAEQESMPLNVIHRDSPDYILPDIQIAGTLRDLVRDSECGREVIPAVS